MLQLFSRQEFEQAVAEHRAERHARGFSGWGQFVAMLFSHLGRAQSLRAPRSPTSSKTDIHAQHEFVIFRYFKEESGTNRWEAGWQ
jgi:hypothetical protein